MNTSHSFLHASRYSGEVVNREPHKCDDLSWFDIDDLPPNTIPYVRRAIQNYRDGVWFDSLGWPGEGWGEGKCLPLRYS